MAKKAKPADPNRLVRDAPGSYHTEDGRLHVRSDAAGAWFLTDDGRTNELGLELVLGPFRSLADAREAVGHQRDDPAGQTAGPAPAPARPRRGRAP